MLGLSTESKIKSNNLLTIKILKRTATQSRCSQQQLCLNSWATLALRLIETRVTQTALIKCHSELKIIWLIIKLHAKTNFNNSNSPKTILFKQTRSNNEMEYLLKLWLQTTRGKDCHPNLPDKLNHSDK